MIGITIIAVGKMKEKYFTEAVNEYKKMLGRYAKAEIIEIKDEPVPDNVSDREKEIILKKESERIKDKIPHNSYVVSLCVEGSQLKSEELAELIENLTNGGKSHFTFIIGGSLGLSDEIKALSSKRISFSKMTFPHRLMRVILTEQLYRAFTISEGKTYHK